LTENGPFLTWGQVYRLGRDRNIRAHGHFEGAPGAPDAHVARLALLLIHGSRDRADAVLLIRDDDRETARRRGLEQGRDAGPMVSPVVIGLAHPMREAWVLVGFLPAPGREQETHGEWNRALSFDPCREAHRLTAKNPERDPKRILRALTGDEEEREVR